MKKILKIILSVIMLGLMLVSTISFAILSVSALTIDSVVIADELSPGETGIISLRLDNDGSEDVEDVSVALDLKDLPFAPYNSASEYSIEEINEDDEEIAEFEIIALNTAKAGVYKIPVLIKYKEVGNNEIKNKSSLISVVVDSKPIIDVTLEDGLLLKGKDNEFTIKITNKGLSDAKFVEAQIGTLSYFNLLTSNKYYIGDIDSDDFDSIDLKVYFNKNAPNNVNLPVTIVYKDDLNKEYRETFNVNMRVYTQSEAVNLGLIQRNNIIVYVIGAVSVLVLYLIYRRLKKRAKVKNK